MEFRPSARRHGIADEDIEHAVARRLFVVELGEGGRVLYLGPDRAGNLLEIVLVERRDREDVAIHAMKMRPRFERLLR